MIEMKPTMHFGYSDCCSLYRIDGKLMTRDDADIPVPDWLPDRIYQKKGIIQIDSLASYAGRTYMSYGAHYMDPRCYIGDHTGILIGDPEFYLIAKWDGEYYVCSEDKVIRNDYAVHPMTLFYDQCNFKVGPLDITVYGRDFYRDNEVDNLMPEGSEWEDFRLEWDAYPYPYVKPYHGVTYEVAKRRYQEIRKWYIKHNRMMHVHKRMHIYTERFRNQRYLYSWEYNGHKYEVINGECIYNSQDEWDKRKNNSNFGYSDIERDIIDSWFNGD